MNAKIFLLFAVVLVCAVDAAVSSTCQRGSSYWCENYKQAKECGALEPCMKYVWKPRIGEDPCDVCHKSVKSIHDYIAANVTQKHFTNAIQDIFSQLENKDECMSLVFKDNEEFLFQQFKKLVSYSDLWCAEPLLCESNQEERKARKNKVLKDFIQDVTEHFSKSKLDPLCINCQLIITQLTNLVRNKVTQKIVRDLIKGPCLYAKKLEKQCAALVDVYLEILFMSAIDSMTPAEKACISLSFCKQRDCMEKLTVIPEDRHIGISDDAGNIEMAKTGQEFFFCETCMLTVQYWETILQFNQTMEVLKLGLIRMCDALPLEYDEQCRKLSGQYGDRIVNLLHHYQNPHLVCTFLFVCSPEVLQGLTNPSILDPFCDTCKRITTFLVDKLRLNSSEKSMEENLKIVCETLPNDREQYCKVIVENYGKILLQFTKDTKIPKKICQRLLLCSVMSNTRTPSLSVSHCQESQDTAITMPEIDVCPLCQRVVKTVERFLRLNETVLTIKNIVSTICIVLPMKQERTCFGIFNHFADEINRRVVFYQNPIIVCKALLYCPPDASAISKPKKQIVCEGCSPLEEAIAEFLPTSYSKELVKLTAQNVCLDLKVKKIKPRVLCSANRPSSLPQVKDNSVCDICKQVVAYLEGVFKMNQTIAVLKTAVVDVCSIFPVEQELQCRGQISQYADNIISMVQLRMKPSAICKLVFVCSSSPSVSLLKSKENVVCDTCKQVVAFLRGVFRVNQTMQAMKSAVAEVCVILPIKREIECKVLVTHYANQIIWYVQQNTNPVAVCETLLKCPAKTPVALPQSEKFVCEACQRIVAVIEVVFNLNRTENIITYIENNLCAILPEDREKQCKDVVNRESSLIIKLLRDSTKPNVICHFIFSCPTTRTSKTLHKITSGKTVVCTTCKKVVAFLESVLQLNVSEVSIKFTIKSLCILLPPERQPKCLEAVDNLFDALVEMVRNRTKPGVICEMIFLCSSSEVIAVEEARGEWVCETCRQIMNMMENPHWINRREAHVMFALTRGCKLLPKLEEAMCKKTVYVYKNHIMAMIRTRKNPTMICKKFTVCPASVMVESKAKVSKPEAVLCDTCKQVVAYLEGVIKINSSLQVIKGAVETMCTILPRTQELICKAQVKQYANTIIALALKGTHPAVICQILRLCRIPEQPTSITTIKEDSLCDACKQAVAFVVGAYQINETLEAIKTVAMQMCTILPMHQELQCIESISKQAENIIALIKMRLNPTSVCQALSCCPERLVKKIKMVKDDTRCITCKQVVGFLKQTFQINQTIAAIEVALEEVCSIFPFDREKQCQEAIARYAKQIVVLIQLRIDPDTICKALNLCSTGQALSVSKPKINVICDTCTHVVAYLEGAFRINQTLEAIRLVVLQACNVLPESQEADCVKNFMEYSDNIFKLIHVRMNPSAICYILFLCPPSRACETCKQVTAYVEGTFGLNQTMAALKGAVLHVCSIFPVKQEIQCKELLSHNADNIIALVQMRLKPSAICKVLLFCTVLVQLRKTPRYNSGPYCALCKAGVNYAEQVYSAKKNEKMLRSAVGTMCQRFPTQYIMKCNGMVYEYGENIMYKLRQSQHPALICQTLDLCVNDVKWSRSGCQNGEEYWCASFSNALQCKALKYCNHIRA